jgi:hypothetical protein
MNESYVCVRTLNGHALFVSIKCFRVWFPRLIGNLVPASDPFVSLYDYERLFIYICNIYPPIYI